MQLWAWCGEIQTQSTGFHGQGWFAPSSCTSLIWLQTHSLTNSSTLITQLIFIQVLWQDKKALLSQVDTCMCTSHALWLVPRDLWASRSVSEPGPPHTGLLLPAALPCSREFIHICIYHPIKPYLNQDNNIFFACRRGECDENTVRRNIMARLFLMKDFLRTVHQKG